MTNVRTQRRRPETYVIKDPRQLQALASPLGQQIVWAMERLGPCSVAELGERVGRAPESLYYHVHRLVEVGLVVELAKRKAARRQESVYELVAERIGADPCERAPEYLSALAAVGSAALRAAERSYRRALEPSASDLPSAPAPMLMQWSARLSAESARELRRRLQEIDDFLTANADASADAAAVRTYSVTTVMSPFPTE